MTFIMYCNCIGQGLVQHVRARVLEKKKNLNLTCCSNVADPSYDLVIRLNLLLFFVSIGQLNERSSRPFLCYGRVPASATRVEVSTILQSFTVWL